MGRPCRPIPLHQYTSAAEPTTLPPPFLNIPFAVTPNIMAIMRYREGDLSSGFVGYRVVATIRGKRYQKYLTLNGPSDIAPSVWEKYQELRARYYEARWMARSAAVQYIDFLKTEHPLTKPFRGVGFHGITLGIGRSNRTEVEQCFIAINTGPSPRKIWITENETLTPAWERAVDYWADFFGIRPKDAERIRRNPPSPDRFKALRKQLNENEGYDYPASVLHHVYAEQRAAIAEQKPKRKPQIETPLGKEDLLSVQSSLAREIANFKKSRSA